MSIARLHQSRGEETIEDSAPGPLRAARSEIARNRTALGPVDGKTWLVVGLLLATTVLTVPPKAGAQVRQVAPPHTAMSHYLRTTDPSTLNRLGCSEGARVGRRSGVSSVIVVLALGRPLRLHHLWGASLFGVGFRSTHTIERTAQAYARGFSRCVGHRHPAHLRVAIGTSNYGPGVTYRHGVAWAWMVNRSNAWAEEQGLAGRVDFAGANDIELGWNGPRTSRAWVQGYDSVGLWPYYDYGDAGGCPPRGNCLGAWTQEDVWYVAWGARSAWPLPEIYTPTGSQAQQWYSLSLYSYRRHGSRMTIAGVLSQHTACRQSADPCWGMDNAPGRAWRQLDRLLNGDGRTAQNLPWLSDIRWQT